MATQIVVQTLHVLSCARCGMLFGIPQDFEQRRRNDHQEFVCPSGHTNYYPQESEAERLTRELKQKNDELARQRAHADQREARLREIAAESRRKDNRINGYKGVVARTKRRVANGRCPCCSHQFKNLEAHMKTRHPNWNPDRHADAIATAKEG